MITIQDEAINKSFNFPSSISEVTEEALTRMTAHVNISAGKSLICLVRDNNCRQFALSVKGSKPAPTAVITLFAKGKELAEALNIKPGDAIIASDDAISRGYHVTIKSQASFGSLVNLVDRNENLRQKMLKEEFITDDGKALHSLYTLEFKIINNFDIVAGIPIDSKIDDPFA